MWFLYLCGSAVCLVTAFVLACAVSRARGVVYAPVPSDPEDERVAEFFAGVRE